MGPTVLWCLAVNVFTESTCSPDAVQIMLLWMPIKPCNSPTNVFFLEAVCQTIVCGNGILQAAVRALDTMASFAAEKNPQVDLTKFVVAGASKVCTRKKFCVSLTFFVAYPLLLYHAFVHFIFFMIFLLSLLL